MNLTIVARSVACATFLSLVAACGGSDSKTGSSAAVDAAPAITTQPADAAVVTGAAAVFSVVATGTSPSYQWSRNGSAIAGATSASYTAPAATAADEGTQYSVVVSNSQGSVTSSTARLHLALSADQQAYESVALAANGGSWDVAWLLQATGTQTDGVNYLYSSVGSLPSSPLLLGPQLSVQGAPTSYTGTLSVPDWEPTWTLKNGAILSIPPTGASSRVSYVGSAIQVDTLASDNATVANSQIRSGFASHALTGTVVSAPTQLAQPFNVIFSNPLALSTSATFAAGSAYITYSVKQNGDRYSVFDCLGNETDGNPTPCTAGTTLTAALTAGEAGDGTTYHLADGSISTIGGVQVWIATTPRPFASVGNSTTAYRIYFQLGSDVYTGMLVKDGTLVTAYHDTLSTGTTYFDYQIRLNKAANDSLAAAVAF